MGWNALGGEGLVAPLVEEICPAERLVFWGKCRDFATLGGRFAGELMVACGGSFGSALEL